MFDSGWGVSKEAVKMFLFFWSFWKQLNAQQWQVLLKAHWWKEESKHSTACKGLEYLTQTGSVHHFRSPIQKLWKINVIYLHPRALNCLTLLPIAACFSLLSCLQSINSGWNWTKHFVDLQESAKKCLASFACPYACVKNHLLLPTLAQPVPGRGWARKRD